MKAFLSLLTLALAAALAATSLRADDSPLPSGSFPASRYESLWKKSPFAVATAEAVPDSPDYVLAGIAEFDGISYASVIERKSNEHFLVSSDKPNHGLTLSSINRGQGGSDTFAVVLRDGESITLKLEAVPPPTAPGSVGNPVPTAGTVPPIIQIPMPGSTPATGSAPYRPLVPPRIHRPLIHLPPLPQQSTPVPSSTPQK